MKKNKGFTLTEIMIATVITGIIATGGIKFFSDMVGVWKNSGVRQLDIQRKGDLFLQILSKDLRETTTFSCTPNYPNCSIANGNSVVMILTTVGGRTLQYFVSDTTPSTTEKVHLVKQLVAIADDPATPVNEYVAPVTIMYDYFEFKTFEINILENNNHFTANIKIKLNDYRTNSGKVIEYDTAVRLRNFSGI